MGLRAVAVLGVITVPIHYAILKRLVAMVETVRAGDPFVAANARRLQVVAWAAARAAADQPRHRRDRQVRLDAGASAHLDAGFRSTAGSRAPHLRDGPRLREGALMREDLEGTV
jgi:hypothetical protein